MIARALRPLVLALLALAALALDLALRGLALPDALEHEA